MLKIDHIIGSVSDAALHDRIHDLEHAHAVDFLLLARQDLSRRRFRSSTEKGSDIAISLARDEQLFDGAVLMLDQTNALVVKVEAEDWLRLTPRDQSSALQVGFHAGNLHWRVRFDGDDLLVAVERELQSYTDRIETLIKDGSVKAHFERGAMNG
ncbi:urease accessory protein UreE [Hoeflea sp.]|uniref:urease accessory protein UreE n=1 Tax=Hoeflea sp. TaxID=1940281 RepID=UPI003749F4B9